MDLLRKYMNRSDQQLQVHPPPRALSVHLPYATFLEDVCDHMKDKHLPSGKEAHTKQWLCPLVSQAVYRGLLTMALSI